MFNNSFIRYSIVGVLTVIIDYMLLYISFSLFNIEQNLSITLSYISASLFNFFMHKKYTFKSTDKASKEILKFVVIGVISYIITIVLINYLVELGLNIYFAKLITVIFTFINVYIISKYYIYRGSLK